MRWYAASLVLVLSACAGDEEVEGDEAFECSDGADNDQDGYFDCDDNGCWYSPDCDGEADTDTDTDTDSDTDADADSDADSDSDADVDCPFDPDNPFNHVTTADVQVTHTLTLANTTICDFLRSTKAFCDCEMTFSGAANTVVETCDEPYRVTLGGSFSRTASTCDCDLTDQQPGTFEQGFWDNLDGDDSAFLTFGMNPNFPQFLDFFTAHEFQTSWAPPASSTPVPRQYAVFAMQDYVFASGQTSVLYTEDETPTIYDCPTTLHTEATITFNSQ